MGNDSSISKKNTITTGTVVLEKIMHYFSMDIIYIISEYVQYPSNEEVKQFLEKVGKHWLNQTKLHITELTIQEALILSWNTSESKLITELKFRPGKLGIGFVGNTITKVEGNSQAETLGVRIGWIIEKINGTVQKNNTTTIVTALKKTFAVGKPVIIEFQYYQNNKTLRELNISKSNKLGFEGIKYISDVLKTNSILVRLSLNDNSMGNSGAQAISYGLKLNLSLTELILSRNQICDVGAKALGEALQINKGLLSLRLDCNYITDVGVLFLCEALKCNTNIKKLSLLGNHIRDNGIIGICDALIINNTLTYLDIRANDVGNPGAEAIYKALEVNKTMVKIDMTYKNHINKNVFSKLTKFQSTLGHPICY